LVSVLNRNLIKIAIDGPAGSGKSTTAREVAKRLRYIYIDSGAMYRAVTLKAISLKIPTTELDKVTGIAAGISIQFKPNQSGTSIFMDGKDISDAIRTPQVNNEINPVAANPEVRKILVRKQQELGKDGGIVMDGRDIGTVVFPDAELKVYMQAGAEERAKRRLLEFESKGISISFKEVLDEIQVRDNADLSRTHGPLRIAADAVIIDTSDLTIQDQIQEVYELALKKIND
jgi:cytidylate kinase